MNIKTTGIRLRHSTESFFIEVEGTTETGVAKGLELKEYQSDFEFGYFFNTDTKRKISLGHLVASQNYFQLFPSGHSFLGAMDYFSRRSIRDTYFKMSFSFSDRLKFELDWNHYQRLDKTSTPFDFSGAKKISSGGGNSNILDIGDEINFILTKEVRSNLLYLPTNSFYSLGLGYFKPTDYFEKITVQPKGDLFMFWLMMDHRF